MSKGRGEYLKSQRGESLSPKKAIMAQCYVCNGEGQGSSEDCKGESCPLYPYFKKWVWKCRGKGRKAIVEPENTTLPLPK